MLSYLNFQFSIFQTVKEISNNFGRKIIKQVFFRLKISSNVPVVRARLPLLKVFKFGVSICIVTVRLGRCSGGPANLANHELISFRKIVKIYF